MELTRREFLIAGTAAGAMPACALSLPQVIYAGAKDGVSEPLERTVMTLCRQCPGGCGLRIRVFNDRVVGIAGNPDHPINRGGVCARAPAAMQTLYNPDRLTTPMMLAGPKGSGEFRPIEWPEAVQRLAERLQTTRQKPGPHGVAVVIGSSRGLMRLLWSRFLQAYGSNNLIDWASPEAHELYPVAWAMQGLHRGIGYDLARTKYVLSFGSQWLDAHWSPAQASNALAAMRSGDPAFRPKFISIEPRLSLTGAKADEWIPIRPGTEGAMAMGLANVLLREGLYDRQFVDQLTHGFEDPPDVPDFRGERIGYRRLVLRDYTPSRVASITGVEEGTIFRLAREFAANKPSLALGFDGSGVATQRVHDRMAIHALNALVGSIDVPGGVTHFQDISLLSQPMPQPDVFAEEGLAKARIDESDTSIYPLGGVPNHLLAERILADVPHRIEVMVLAGANPVFDSPHPDRMKQALGKVPFVVSLSPWLDDSARWADMIIPDRHFLTTWDLDSSHTLTGQPAVTIGQPVVPGPPGTRSSADLVLELARRVGGPVAEALPFKDAQSAVHALCETLAASGRGVVFGPIEEVGWIRLLERGGWRPPPTRSPAEFYDKVLSTGGWYDPLYYHREWNRVFRSPPRRFAFHSVVISDRTRPKSPVDDIRCLPHYEPNHEPNVDPAFPLQLYVYPLALLAGLTDVNVPWLIDGDTVVVTSPRGEMRTKAKLFEGIMPDVVAMPWGLGHEGGGRWSDGVGQNPANLVDVQTDPLTSGAFWNATRVSVQKA
jgi:anaerobic selenocysteine-containing dehydrogenase